MATDKRITSDAFLDRLKLIFSNLPDELLSLDIQLRPNLMAVLQITRYATDSDKPDQITRGADDTVEQSLAVYDVSDFDDVMKQNERMKDILGRIIEYHERSEVNYDAMREGAELLVQENRKCHTN